MLEWIIGGVGEGVLFYGEERQGEGMAYGVVLIQSVPCLDWHGNCQEEDGLDSFGDIHFDLEVGCCRKLVVNLIWLGCILSLGTSSLLYFDVVHFYLKVEVVYAR